MWISKCCHCLPKGVEYRVGGKEIRVFQCCKHPSDRTDWSIVGDIHTS